MRAIAIVLGLVLIPPQEANFTANTGWAAGLGQITGLAWAPNGTNVLFVSQKTGEIRIVRNGAVQAAAFATLTVNTTNECGLVGICLDPDYAAHPYVYVYATVSDTEQRIVRFTATTDGGGNVVAAANSRVDLVTGIPCMDVNHDGGGIAIGQDGYLYFACGNLGNGNNVGGNYLPSPNLNTPNANVWDSMASKISRADRFTGEAAPANPRYDPANRRSARSYGWARGFRNPFTMTFQPGTNNLWVNVVGDQYEQIFVVPQDGNAGWRNGSGLYEPNATSADAAIVNASNGYLNPRFAYPTNGSPPGYGGCITGGCFYTGTTFPAAYQGNFFFADYNTGNVMRARVNGTAKLAASDVSLFYTGATNATDVAVGPDGALYVGLLGGSIHRIAYSGSAPQALVASATTLDVPEGGNASFNVRLQAAPAADVVVTVTRTSGTADVTATASLTFTPGNWSADQPVLVTAADDPDTMKEGATLEVSSPGLASRSVVVTALDDDGAGAPTATLLQPLNGAVVSGATAEFYGNGSGGGGTTRAQFFVDGVLQDEDANTSGHYHVNGTHLAWDTTGLVDGPHTLRMTVFNAGGASGSHEIVVFTSNGVSGGGGGGGGGGCGVLGLEILLISAGRRFRSRLRLRA